MSVDIEKIRAELSGVQIMALDPNTRDTGVIKGRLDGTVDAAFTISAKNRREMARKLAIEICPGMPPDWLLAVEGIYLDTRSERAPHDPSKWIKIVHGSPRTFEQLARLLGVIEDAAFKYEGEYIELSPGEIDRMLGIPSRIKSARRKEHTRLRAAGDGFTDFDEHQCDAYAVFRAICLMRLEEAIARAEEVERCKILI